MQKMFLYNFYKLYGEKKQRQGITEAAQRAELMRLLDISRATLANIEKATTPRLSPAELTAICRYFDCEETDLVNYSNAEIA